LEQFLKYPFLESYYFDLQLFAANPEDEGRTEEATEKRKKKSREEGQVAKSQDFISSLVFLFSFWTLWLMAQFIFLTLKNLMADSFKAINKPFSFNDVTSYIGDFSLTFWKLTGPIFLTAVVVGIFANVLQVGFMFSTKIIQPKFNRISFTFEKLREKIFFSKQMMFNLLFSIVKVVILGIIFYIIIKADIKEIINMADYGIEQSLAVILNTALKMFNAAGIFLLSISIPDYLIKKKQHADSLKMSKQDIKQEYKEEEGDPMIKGYIRDMYNKMLSKASIRKTVPEATVVITNPTHFAVAVKYDPVSFPTPVVIAKGEDDEALLIRQIAFENDVPVVEDKPLARSLYKLTNVGDEIPSEFFSVIATLLVNVGAIKNTA